MLDMVSLCSIQMEQKEHSEAYEKNSANYEVEINI